MEQKTLNMESRTIKHHGIEQFKNIESKLPPGVTLRLDDSGYDVVHDGEIIHYTEHLNLLDEYVPGLQDMYRLTHTPPVLRSYTSKVVGDHVMHCPRCQALIEAYPDDPCYVHHLFECSKCSQAFTIRK